MLFKTVLAPGAPWPKPEEPKIVKPKPKPKPKPKAKRAYVKKLAFPRDGLDYFAEARYQIATGAARGRFQQGSKNIKDK
jgi:hypothetical protein